MARLILLVLALAAALARAAGAQEPLGVVGTTLARFDRDTLQPVGPAIAVAEPHTGPALSPGGGRFALGVSSNGAPGLPGEGRVGLWIVDTKSMTITTEVRTGIAGEAVVFPGRVGALLQSGVLVVVDPDGGEIVSRRRIGYSSCAPPAVHAAGRGVLVNELHARGAEVAIVDARGRVRTRLVRVDTSAAGCRRAALVTDGDRAYVVGRTRVAVLDPRTGRTVTRRVGDLGRDRTAAPVPGGLAVASERGLRVLDTRTWRVRWRRAGVRSVLAAGRTVIASGGEVHALDARTGRLRWRAPGHAVAVAAGRVYAQPAVYDLRTGTHRGRHPIVHTALRLTDRR